MVDLMLHLFYHNFLKCWEEEGHLSQSTGVGGMGFTQETGRRAICLKDIGFNNNSNNSGSHKYNFQILFIIMPWALYYFFC